MGSPLHSLAYDRRRLNRREEGNAYVVVDQRALLVHLDTDGAGDESSQNAAPRAPEMSAASRTRLASFVTSAETSNKRSTD